MTIQFQPEQARVIDEAIQAGLIGRADEVVEVGLETLRSRLESHSAFIRCWYETKPSKFG